MKTQTIYNTAYLAGRLGVHQGSLQRLLKARVPELAPTHRLKGIGSRPAQYGWTEQALSNIVTWWQTARGALARKGELKIYEDDA